MFTPEAPKLVERNCEADHGFTVGARNLKTRHNLHGKWAGCFEMPYAATLRPIVCTRLALCEEISKRRRRRITTARTARGKEISKTAILARLRPWEWPKAAINVLYTTDYQNNVTINMH